MASTEHLETGQVGAEDDGVHSAPVGTGAACGPGKS
jgi:hypothetical protein